MSRKASGLKAWAVQRATAIYIGLYLLYLILALLFAAPAGYAEWRAWFQAPLMSVATLVFVFSLLLHSWVGVRDVLIDYVHPIALRAGLLTVVAIVLIGSGIWATQALTLVRLV